MSHMKKLTDEEFAAVRRTLSGSFGSAKTGLAKLLENYQAQLEQGLHTPKGEHGSESQTD